MLTLTRGLDDRALAAIARPEAEVVAADGVRLKLESEALRTRDPAGPRCAVVGRRPPAGLCRRSWRRPSGTPVLPDRPGDCACVAELAGVPVGTLRLGRTAAGAGIYGFAVDPARQGRELGRDLLARACRVLRVDGDARVTLEVATRNVGALSLSLSTGVVRAAGEDGRALPPHVDDATAAP